jgi:hypothetical protein
MEISMFKIKKSKVALSIALTLILISSFGIYAVAYAETAEADTIVQEDSSGTFNLIKADSGLISPYSTFIGNAGTCTLDYMGEGKYIKWNVKPATASAFYFYGYVIITDFSSGQVLFSEPVGGVGVTGFTGTGGLVDLYNRGLIAGHMYKAQLTGTAEAMDGSGVIFHVVSDAIIPFMY